MSIRALILIVVLWAFAIGLVAAGQHALAGMVAIASIVGLRMLALAGRSGRA